MNMTPIPLVPTYGTWNSSFVLRLCGHQWNIEIDNELIQVTFNGKIFYVSPEKVKIVEGKFPPEIEVEDERRKKYLLNGLSLFQLKDFKQKLADSLLHFYYKHPERVFPYYKIWKESFVKQFEEEKKRGWSWVDSLEPYQIAKPTGIDEIKWMLHVGDIQKRLDPEFFVDGFSDIKKYVEKKNRDHLLYLIKKDADFFDNIEKNPLTEEQRKAVACYAPRTLVIASAGSGKSSILVAKTLYALKEHFFYSSEILLLTFNKEAARSLRNKISAHTKENINVSTFHSFCLSVIGKATGIKPSVSPSIVQGKDLMVIQSILEELSKNPSYKNKLSFFKRVYCSRNLYNQKKSASAQHPDDGAIYTILGERVKSKAEKIFADMLLESNIKYFYEKKYPLPTADSAHRQYCPDFFLPQINVWVEVWALRDGEEETPEFAGYQESKAWKREIHRKNNTSLWNVYAADLKNPREKDKVFDDLLFIFSESRKELKPENTGPQKALSYGNSDFANLLRTFQIHAYNNNLSLWDLRNKVSHGSMKTNPANRTLELLGLKEFGLREKLFLDLYEPVEKQWRQILKENDETDFETMMRHAAELIESGKWQSPYQLIMVDEFQDTSQLRARILKALLKTQKTRLFAVGDDWQSINRFAGSDISIMREFSKYFGEHEQLLLTRTFRCSSSICEISGKFVKQNPDQIDKEVKPAFSSKGKKVKVLQIDNSEDILRAVKSELAKLDSLALLTEKIRSVAILGRYRKDCSKLSSSERGLERIIPSHYPHLDISYSTIHSAKGMEYDHIIVPRIERGNKGFPCEIEDNPILNLAMPNKESYPFAEERRLLYVAITRARDSATLIAPNSNLSVFVKELVNPKLGYEVKVEKLTSLRDGVPE